VRNVDQLVKFDQLVVSRAMPWRAWPMIGTVQSQPPPLKRPRVRRAAAAAGSAETVHRTALVPARTAEVRSRRNGPISMPAADARPDRDQRRRDKEEAILREAERQFARNGFEGSSLEGIAAALGFSRHHLLYYFPSKEALYRRVIDDVVTQWLEGMGALAASDDPAAALQRYIDAKLRSSAERPEGTSVFTQEVMAGAPRYADAIVERVLPVLRADVKVFERWAGAGQVQALPFTHLMFVLWAATQAYADLAPQFALLLGKPALDAADFAAARQVITRLVLGGLGLAAAPSDAAPAGQPRPPARKARR
jgi:TetR/AcrR family transcriptional regulator